MRCRSDEALRVVERLATGGRVLTKPPELLKKNQRNCKNKRPKPAADGADAKQQCCNGSIMVSVGGRMRSDGAAINEIV